MYTSVHGVNMGEKVKNFFLEKSAESNFDGKKFVDFFYCIKISDSVRWWQCTTQNFLPHKKCVFVRNVRFRAKIRSHFRAKIRTYFRTKTYFSQLSHKILTENLWEFCENFVRIFDNFSTMFFLSRSIPLSLFLSLSLSLPISLYIIYYL